MKRLLIAGFGDIARRAAAAARARAFELAPLLAQRTDSTSIGRKPCARRRRSALLHCAPPPDHGAADTRTANLLAALEKGRILPARIVYVSTSGVYGDCAGARVDESRPLAPHTERARAAR